MVGSGECGSAGYYELCGLSEVVNFVHMSSFF